jgi:hypothetical protein
VTDLEKLMHINIKEPDSLSIGHIRSFKKEIKVSKMEKTI